MVQSNTALAGARLWLFRAGCLTRRFLGLIHALSALDDCDYLVVDTAAGISDNVTVLFGACDIKLLLIQNDPSIADHATVKVLQRNLISQTLCSRCKS